MMLLPLLAVVTANKSPLPSFLMILGDDIGWADFKWNNGELCTGFVSPPSNLAKQHVFFPFSLLSRFTHLFIPIRYTITGTANTPRMAEWAARAGSILMQDSHSGGTVCSPTRGICG